MGKTGECINMIINPSDHIHMAATVLCFCVVAFESCT